VNRQEIRIAIGEFLAERNNTNGSSPVLEDGRNLFEAGDIDSFGFLELLLFLGEKTGREFDLSDKDPSELAAVGALLDYFAGDSHQN
jgi:acyl carrier protein